MNAVKVNTKEGISILFVSKLSMILEAENKLTFSRFIFKTLMV